MRLELERKLIERWPTWFDVNGSLQQTLMPFGCEHGDGWFNLLWRLCEDLEPLVAKYEKQTGHRFQVVQVKEKFGGLRFYVANANDVIRQRIELAELESLKSCELCGKPGRRRIDGWINVLCDEMPTEEQHLAQRRRNECPQLRRSGTKPGDSGSAQTASVNRADAI